MPSPSAPPASSLPPIPPAVDKRRRWHRRWQWELLLLVYAAYDGSRLLVHNKEEQAEHHGEMLLHAERRFRMEPEHWLNSAFAHHAWLGVPADYIYASLHYLVTPLVLIWMWRSHRAHYAHARTWLGLATVFGLVGFVLFPTAPPRLLPHGGGFHDTMAQHAAVGWWGASGSAPQGLGSMTNDFAAMPSLHVGWALWSGLLIYRYARHRVVRVLGLLYPFVIALVVMGTANHYLLDCLAGTAVTLLGLAVVGPMLRWTGRRAARRRQRPVPDYAVRAADGPARSGPAVPSPRLPAHDDRPDLNTGPDRDFDRDFDRDIDRDTGPDHGPGRDHDTAGERLL
ncbi:phosphatase PAP2 family protein [Streptacidiphilus sp. EB129]|uniref:phosphatase PAP2 family protein n=1 Tax=Streptacidiphilus sp. EB129 TaxID=3156262 RepID=UPI0035167D6C